MGIGRLKNQIAVITGAAAALGRASALLFAGEGAVVILCGRQLSPLEKLKQQIVSLGGRAHAVRTDATQEADVQTLVELVRSTYGRIDILVNHAAAMEPGTAVETSLDSWNYHLEHNLTSAFLLTRACLPLMRQQQYGRIVNITAGLSGSGTRSFAAYSASKAGLESLTRSIAREESGYDLLINMYIPGTVKAGGSLNASDPQHLAPDLLRLVTLAPGSWNGHLFEAQNPA